MLPPAVNIDRAHGFTLVELIATIAILAIAAIGISSALAFAMRHQADSMTDAKVVALVQAYSDEIMAKRYDENTPLGGLPACSTATTPCSSAAAFDDGENRADYDDVDDFDGLDDAPPRQLDGTPLTDYASYRVQVNVRYPTPAQASTLGVASSTDAKIIDIVVSDGSGSQQTFSVVRANF